MHKHPIISYQPLRLLFQLVYIINIIGRLPAFFLSALIPALRPHPRWTAKNAFMVRLSRAAIDMWARIGITESLSLEKGKEGDRFQVVGPARLDLYQGPLLSDVKPVVVGGTWFPGAPVSDIASKMIVLYLHGGAYVQGDGRTEGFGFLANTLLENSGVDAVFSVQYRLSGYSGLNPFPAALQDALTCYIFLLQEHKVPPHHVILCGDSAGGNLAIALLRYIQEFGDNIGVPPPRCAALFSPWVSPFDLDRVNNRNRHSDYLPTSFLRWGSHAYAGDLPNAVSHPYISPLGQPFASATPIFINTGSAELFCDADIRWAEEMKAVEGNVIELHLEDGACHDTLFAGGLLGFETSVRETVLKLRSFISGS